MTRLHERTPGRGSAKPIACDATVGSDLDAAADLEALLDRAAGHGTPGLVIDQPGSIAQLALAGSPPSPPA